MVTIDKFVLIKYISNSHKEYDWQFFYALKVSIHLCILLFKYNFWLDHIRLIKQ